MSLIQLSIMWWKRAPTVKSETLGFKSCNSLIMQIWEIYSTSLNLNFIICKVRMIILPLCWAGVRTRDNVEITLHINGFHTHESTNLRSTILGKIIPESSKKQHLNLPCTSNYVHVFLLHLQLFT